MPGELSLAAADIEHGRHLLVHEAPCNAFVHVRCERVPSKHGTRQAEAVRIPVIVGRDRAWRRLVGHRSHCCGQRSRERPAGTILAPAVAHGGRLAVGERVGTADRLRQFTHRTAAAKFHGDRDILRVP